MMIRVVSIFFAALSICSRSIAFTIDLAARAIDRAVAALCDMVGSAARPAFDVPALHAVAGPIGSFFNTSVDRHEARFHRRSAARNI